MAMAHCAAGFVAGLPLVSRQAGLQLLHLLDAQVIGPLLAFSALCELLAITCLYGLEHFRLDVLLMHGEAWAPVLEAAWKWFLPTLLSVTLAGGLLTGGCGGAEAPQDLPGACMAAWLLIAVGVAQVPLWAIKAAMSRHDQYERLKGADLVLGSPSLTYSAPTNFTNAVMKLLSIYGAQADESPLPIRHATTVATKALS
ncbi:hypothetical protein V5799_002335 [Amblyomma americanum]|uniref:Uncharacterized protein n=1 Tax=Amblyomma americanum TaxID=6943 RepID=A0AAQ4CXM4_AMBAM